MASLMLSKFFAYLIILALVPIGIAFFYELSKRCMYYYISTAAFFFIMLYIYIGFNYQGIFTVISILGVLLSGIHSYYLKLKASGVF